MNKLAPKYSEICAAQKRIKPFIHETPLLTSKKINSFSGKNVYFKCENLQKSGSFKIRGALNAILALKEENSFVKGVTAHSSGNHGIAVSLAAQIVGLPCSIVVPDNTPQVKVNAIKEYGAEVVFCQSSPSSRRDVCNQLAERTGYSIIPPYDHNHVIAGQGTIALEILKHVKDLDGILVPVSGGGMISGIAITTNAVSPNTKVFAVEPLGKNLEECLIEGKRLWSNPPQFLPTMAEGIKTQQLGEVTFPIVHEYVEHNVFTVSDEEMVSSMHFLMERMKLVIELSSAAGVAALLSDKMRKMTEINSVAVVLCGGNVDLRHLPS